MQRCAARLRAAAPALALVALAAAPASAGEPQGLAARLDAALAAPALRGARVSALVVGREDGRTLYARHPDLALVPASNLKLLTAVAVLDRFGPAHRFATEVLASAPPDAEGAVDALYLRGGGDPALTSEDYWRLAADLRLRGLRRVRGDLVIDDTLFDDVRWHPSWGDATARAYHAPVGAAMANYGAFRVTVTPRSAGQPAAVALDPPVPYLALVARVATGPPGGKAALHVRRSATPSGERVEVEGRVPQGSPPRDVWRSVADPARYTGAVLRLQLEAVGIAVGGATRVAPVADGAASLHRFEGRPLAEVVRLFLKYSTNPIAEALFKHLGRPEGANGVAASWARAAQEGPRRLAGLGVDVRHLVWVDGSGLSRDDRVPARVLVETLLAADRSFRLGPELVAALPIAARDGTLERRASGAAERVRAKTGLLSGVTGLSGFARDAAGRERVFSVLANGYAGSDGEAMDALDAFAAALARDGA